MSETKRRRITPVPARDLFFWAPENGHQSLCLPYREDDSWSLVREGRLVVGPSGVPKAGQGLFVRQPVREGDVVAPYTGEVIDAIELNRRYGRRTAPYALSLGDGWFVDAAGVRGVGGMANDPHGSGTEKNAEFEVLGGELAVVATRDIRRGEEILVDYRGTATGDPVYEFGDDRHRVVRGYRGEVPDHATILSLLGLPPPAGQRWDVAYSLGAGS